MVTLLNNPQPCSPNTFTKQPCSLLSRMRGVSGMSEALGDLIPPEAPHALLPTFKSPYRSWTCFYQQSFHSFKNHLHGCLVLDSLGALGIAWCW